jgi:DNA-binding IclR family transcriptional regulator
VIASLSIFLPESRFTSTHKETILKELRSAAQQINERLQMEV